jgi:hypothetical protein
MNGDFEAAGATFTAGLAASVIDSNRDGQGHEAHCPCANCGAILTGDYCATCGQPAHVHRSLGHMAEEFLHGILHFDSRAWRTLPLLVFRPGTLTYDYIHGKRARFISPLAMFLLAVFTMFFVFSLSGGSAIGVSDPTKQAADSWESSSRLLEAARRAAPPNAPAVSSPFVISDDQGFTITNETPNVYEKISEAAKKGEINIHTGSPDLDKKILHKLENPELAVYKLQNSAYKLAFLLAPISLPFVWLLFFWKKGMTLFDHTVFILYSLSFISALFIVLSLISMIPAPTTDFLGLLLLSIPVHFYFHLKGSYALGWFSALWRLPLLIFFALISLSFFLLAIFLLGLGFVG